METIQWPFTILWEKTRLSNHISKFTCQPSLPTPASLSFPIKPALASLGNNLNEY